MMYLSLSVALSMILLHVSSASEVTLPSTRGGATAISKCNGEDNIDDYKINPHPISGTSNAIMKEFTQIGSRVEKRSRSNSALMAGKVLRKSRSKKNVASGESTSAASAVKDMHDKNSADGLVVTGKIEEFIEPMCRPDTGRFALFPIRNHRMWEMYKKHVASFWTVRLLEHQNDKLLYFQSLLSSQDTCKSRLVFTISHIIR